MKRFLTSTFVLLLVIGLAGFCWYKTQFATNATKSTHKPVLVSTVSAQFKTVPVEVHAIGQIYAPETVILKSQTTGIIQKIYVHNGEHVHEGQLLVQIDSASAKANYDAQSAKYLNLKQQYERLEKLYKLNPVNISASQLSMAKDNALAAKGLMEAAKNQLDNTQIKAPFEGIVGFSPTVSTPVTLGSVTIAENAQIHQGTYLNAGEAVAIISNLNHLFVQYQVPESYSEKIKLGQQVEVHASAFANRTFLAKVTYISPVIYQNTQSYTVRAKIINPDPRLRSGMTVSIAQVVDPDRKVLTIPGIALIPSLSGYSVYVVKKSKVAQIPVHIGERFGHLVAIRSGLSPGVQVIFSGNLTVHPGMTVKVEQRTHLKS